MATQPLRAQTLRDVVASLFAPSATPVPRVGVEVELIAVTDEPTPRPAHPLWLKDHLPYVSFEPGGQLELSPPPREDVEELIAEVEQLMARAESLAAQGGVRLEASGVNQYHDHDEVPLRLATARYRAMQDLFDESGVDGRRMMRCTASLQVNVDLLPGHAGWEQWAVANEAGPELSQRFDTSGGRRTRIWQGIDAERTGMDGRHLDFADPVGAYTAFAAAARRIPIPEAADDAYHLSTLFPPVRPRGGRLEIRYLDAQPIERLGEAIRAVTSLLLGGRTWLSSSSIR